MGGHGGVARTTPAVELVRLDEDTSRVRTLRTAVLRHRLGPGQNRFVTLAVNTLPRADADPDRTPFAVVHEDRAVGFGILDRGGVLHELTDAPAESVLLRAFYIDPRWQGRGLGRAACIALPGLAREIVPSATVILLTVNQDNHVARSSYLASGFVDTGRVYLGGEAGPQDVLVRADLQSARTASPATSEADNPAV